MKTLFCAYDRPGHLATGPNAWLQRLIPDLITRYQLDIHTLILYAGNINECPTAVFFKKASLPLTVINTTQLSYTADQVKALLKVVKKEQITTVVANLVIPAFYAIPYLKSFNIPVIGVMHSNDTFYKGVIKKFIHGSAVNQLDVSVSVSNYINNLVEANNNNTQALVIPCGTPKSKAQTHRVAKDKLKVIYAGRLEIQQKQILKLTEAFVNASVTNSRLEFSIYGSGSQKSQVTSILENFKSLHHTEYKGAVKPSEMLDVMAKHHVFTLMSDYEGMPVALMEAMSCGVVPVCLHEESGINEIIEHGVNGFIVKDRSEDYQEKLKLLADDKALWTTMSKNAIETIKQYYSSDITNKKWFDILQQFKNLKPKKVYIPFRVKLTGNLLHYGDNRKPALQFRLKQQWAHNWLAFKMAVRPRARLKSVLKK